MISIHIYIYICIHSTNSAGRIRAAAIQCRKIKMDDFLPTYCQRVSYLFKGRTARHYNYKMIGMKSIGPLDFIVSQQKSKDFCGAIIGG